MGLDWERLSLSAYMEALEACNEMNDPEAAKKAEKSPDAMKRLDKFMASHRT